MLLSIPAGGHARLLPPDATLVERLRFGFISGSLGVGLSKAAGHIIGMVVRQYVDQCRLV
jgi:hypothetical protein